MNQEQTHNVFIGLLAAGLLLVGTMVFFQGRSLNRIQNSVQSISNFIVQNEALDRCVESGGVYGDNKCACAKNYFLEDGSCMGQDGLTQKELEEIKTNLEKLMNQTACLDSGGQFNSGTCVCGRDYILENGECIGQDGLTQKELEGIKANQERLMNGR